MAKPLIVGEAPARTGDPGRPITGACGRKLAALSGLSFEEFLRRFARANVLGTWPGESGKKGASFPLAAARENAGRVRRRFVRGRTVVLLGHRTASAFGVRARYFEPIQIGSARAVVVPHPSGVNRWYNERSNARRMRRFMRSIA